MFSWFFSGRRRRKLLAEEVPASWREIVAQNVGIYGLLPPREQQRLLVVSRLIAAERRWVGCQGLDVTDEMRATVAAQAALLLLGVEGYYFDKLPSILLYPGTFQRPHHAGHMIVDEDAAALGESWQRGSIVLSWPAALAGGRDPRDGQNVVLHEFAHHLDSLDGEQGGHPPQPSREAADKWDRVIDAEYARLLRMLSENQPTALDSYAAESKAEFFSVATESFFERPAELSRQHTALYAILRDFYRVDPQEWFAQRSNHEPLTKTERIPKRSKRTGQRDSSRPALEWAEDYFTRGWDAFLDGRYKEAEADFSEVLLRDPTDLEALTHRAECRLQRRNWHGALADAEAACQIGPADTDALRIRGMCRAAAGENEAAIQDLTKALADQPSSVDARFYRGLALAELSRWQEAIADFTAVIRLDPADAEAWLERSNCYEAIGDEKSAERDRQRAIALDATLE